MVEEQDTTKNRNGKNWISVKNFQEHRVKFKNSLWRVFNQQNWIEEL